MRRASAWVLVVAVALGTWLRLQQLGAQVLIDDEWHAVHQVMHHFPRAMLLDFGFADYSIPLGLLYWLEAQWLGLSELAMRWPMVACGLVTLVLFPLYVARRLSWPVAALFAVLLALSPLLVIYSRMARPYAVTLLLGWIAHAAFHRFLAAPRRVGAGAAYAGSAALATWLHPIVGPFVLAPFLYAVAPLSRAEGGVRAGLRSRALLRLIVLALCTAALTGALVLPPLLANTHSMAAKSGIDSPTVATMVGAAYLWMGTGSTPVLLACVALAIAGAMPVWRAMPEARSGVLGLALTLTALLVTRPMFSYNPIALARYLLPALPLVLLAVATGTLRLGMALRQRTHARAAAATAALVPVLAAFPVLALAATSPLAPMLRRPNTESLHFVYHFDFRPDHNPYLPYMARIPLSPFWASLAHERHGSVRVAAAPFHFESFNWDAPRWEALSGQVVLPGFITGLCVGERPGETPLTPAFRLRNAVHLASAEELRRRHIDYIVWQKPYDQVADGQPARVNDDVAACEQTLRERFGTPVYEDATLVAFRPPARR